MMPAIRISEENYEWLKSQAVPFEDTPDRVLTRLRKQLQSSPAPEVQTTSKETTTNGVQALDPMNPGDLTFTVPMTAQIGNVNASQREWKAITHAIHAIAAERFSTFEELQAATIARVELGDPTSPGFTHVGGTKFSIEPMDANSAWRSTLHLAIQLKIPVEITLRWRNTAKAAHPGETAQLSWLPS